MNPMPEPRPTPERMARALAALDRDRIFPPTPALAASVSARLLADRAAASRPRLPWLAIRSRRRVLAVAALGVLAVLSLALGTRLVLGSAEIRVQPGVTPSGPPLGPDELGTLVPVDRLSAAAGFRVRLPAGPDPDEAYAIETDDGTGVLLAWEAEAGSPPLPGTPWGFALMEVVSDGEQVVKTVARFEDVLDVTVGGRRAFWITIPHQLLIETDAGTREFSVAGNVLIWTEGDITFRLETPLGRADAIALAEGVG